METGAGPGLDPEALEEARGALDAAARVLILTGAGVSAESGVPTFRGEQGLWKRHRPEELATPSAFRRDPRLVWEWYAYRRGLVAACEPNAGHRALARFQAARPGVTLVTQNVDGLHERARREAGEVGGGGYGAPPLELHGSLFRVRCVTCGERTFHTGEIDAASDATLPRCPCGGLLRPDVVWFGESLDPAVLERAFAAASGADVGLVVGTSAVVQPAASLPWSTLESGGFVVEVNPEATPLSSRASARLVGPAGAVLPRLFEPWIGRGEEGAGGAAPP